MKKKLIVALLMSLTVASLAGCSFAIVDDTYMDNYARERLESDESDEQDSDEDEDNEEEVETSKESEKTAEVDLEDSHSSSDWANISYTDDKSAIVAEYSNGISDSETIWGTSTFKDLCDWLEYASPNYPKESLRRVVSVYFGKKDWYADALSAGQDNLEVLFAHLATIAWYIDSPNSLDGVVQSVSCDVDNPSVYKFNIKSNSLGNVVLVWDSSKGNSFEIGKEGSDSFTTYTLVKYDDSVNMNYIAVQECFKGNKAGADSSQSTEITESSSSSDSTMSKVDVATRDEIVENLGQNFVDLIEDYYDSTITKLENTSTSDSVSAIVTMENGKQCRILVTDKAMTVSDWSDTFEVFYTETY